MSAAASRCRVVKLAHTQAVASATLRQPAKPRIGRGSKQQAVAAVAAVAAQVDYQPWLPARVINYLGKKACWMVGMLAGNSCSATATCRSLLPPASLPHSVLTLLSRSTVNALRVCLPLFGLLLNMIAVLLCKMPKQAMPARMHTHTHTSKYCLPTFTSTNTTHASTIN